MFVLYILRKARALFVTNAGRLPGALRGFVYFIRTLSDCVIVFFVLEGSKVFAGGQGLFAEPVWLGIFGGSVSSWCPIVYMGEMLIFWALFLLALSGV